MTSRLDCDEQPRLLGHDFVLLAPDGSPVSGGDDFKAYFAGFN
jgi:hypothetical protein